MISGSFGNLVVSCNAFLEAVLREDVFAETDMSKGLESFSGAET